MKLGTIIVATDFSDPARVAVDRAAEIARRTKSELVVVHASAPTPTIATAREAVISTQDRLQAMQQIRRANASQRLEALVAELGDEGLQATGEMLDGAPTHAIPSYASERGAGLLVTGARGLTDDRMFIIGSVAEGLVRRATTNVLVVRGEGARDGFSRILVATDLTEASEAVIPMSLTIASADADAELMHVVDWGLSQPEITGAHGSPLPDFEELWKEAIDEARAELDGFVERAGRVGSTIRHRVVEGVAAVEILEHVRREGVDLLVVGKSTERPPMHESVAERLVRQAPCSVLVARHVA